MAPVEAERAVFLVVFGAELDEEVIHGADGVQMQDAVVDGGVRLGFDQGVVGESFDFLQPSGIKAIATEGVFFDDSCLVHLEDGFVDCLVGHAVLADSGVDFFGFGVGFVGE